MAVTQAQAREQPHKGPGQRGAWLIQDGWRWGGGGGGELGWDVLGLGGCQRATTGASSYV